QDPAEFRVVPGRGNVRGRTRSLDRSGARGIVRTASDLELHLLWNRLPATVRDSHLFQTDPWPASEWLGARCRGLGTVSDADVCAAVGISNYRGRQFLAVFAEDWRSRAGSEPGWLDRLSSRAGENEEAGTGSSVAASARRLAPPPPPSRWISGARQLQRC